MPAPVTICALVLAVILGGLAGAILAGACVAFELALPLLAKP